MNETKKDVFNTLNKIDVTKKAIQKNGLDYLPWATAWEEVKKLYPSANYKVYETPEGINYFTDGITGWVKVGVTIEDLEHIEYLPIMDFKNKSIEKDKITSFEVNKTIQRAITKAIARHGLGLSLYTKEDKEEESKKNKNEGVKIDLDKKLVAEALTLKIELNKVAAYYKKPVEALTNEDLQNAINSKRKAMNAGGQNNGK